MELILTIRILLRYWRLALVPAVIAAALTLPALLRDNRAVSGGYSTFISYSAAQALDAIPNRDGDYQDVWLASELAVNALTDWLPSTGFRRAVAEQTAAQGLTIDPAALSIAADNERSVGQIFLSWDDADQLAIIAQAVISVLRTQNQDAFPQMGGVPAEITILNEPVISAAPPPLTDRFAPIIRIGLGLLVGVGLAFLAHYLDPTLRRREDVETAGLPVIASIPRR